MSEAIDLRSDAVTRPTEAMWSAMRSDGLAWSRFGDSTVRALEERAAHLTGTAEAVFAPTGTLANTLALLAITRPGDAFVVDRRAHVIMSEDRSFARLAGLYPETLVGERGQLSAVQVEAALSLRHLGTVLRTPLVWLENTHTAAGGTVAGPNMIAEIAEVAARHGASVHIDGARLFNAACALGLPPVRLVPPGASVTINLNKGLGAPAGAVLCGPAAIVAEARARLLGLGGILAQAGLIAAAGLVALEDSNVAQLAVDGALAATLAAALSRVIGTSVSAPETNIVFLELPVGNSATAAKAFLAARGVHVLAYGERALRLVTHRDVQVGHVPRVVAAFTEMLASRQA